MTDTHESECAQLRATIGTRGTARMFLLPFVFLGWAAAAIGAAGVITVAISTLLPLLVLAAGFEAILALHSSAERLARYVQVFHGPRRSWEAIDGAYSQRFPGNPDPLFGRLFVLAISVNFLPAALNFEFVAEPVLLAVAHFILINRIRTARLAAAARVPEDLRRFNELRDRSDPS